MRSTHDHEDRVRYWLTDAIGGGQPISNQVFMVMSRPKSKVYYCFIKLLGIFLQKDCHIHNYCFFYRARCSKFCFVQAARSRRKAISLVETNATPLLIGRKQNPEYTAWEHLRSIHSEVHSSKCRLGQSETSRIGENSSVWLKPALNTLPILFCRSPRQNKIGSVLRTGFNQTENSWSFNKMKYSHDSNIKV